MITRSTLAESLQRAIQAEGDGHHFYLMAAASTHDPQGKAIFETLAREELDHARFLRAQYHAVETTGRPDPQAHLGPRAELSGPSPIFSPELRARIGEAHFEMSALSIAIGLELSAMQFYRDQAARAEDAVVRGFFSELSEWESGHYQALLRQQEGLREDYWSTGGFSPF